MGDTIGQSDNKNGGGVFGFLSDLVGAAADVAKTISGKRQAGDQPSYIPQTGIDQSWLRIGVIVLVVVVIYKIVKG